MGSGNYTTAILFLDRLIEVGTFFFNTFMVSNGRKTVCKLKINIESSSVIEFLVTYLL